MELRPVAYRTLATQIRDAIRNGEYADGRQLPTEEQLAATYSVSRQTVRRAMQDLVSEGIIYRVAGRGTYPVAEQDRYVNHFGSVEELMALSLDTECEVVSPLQRKVDVGAASGSGSRRTRSARSPWSGGMPACRSATPRSSCRRGSASC